MEQAKERILEEAGQFINISLVYDEKYTEKILGYIPTIHLETAVLIQEPKSN